MSKTSIIVILGVAVITLLAVILWRDSKDSSPPSPPPDPPGTNVEVEVISIIDGKTNTVVEVVPTKRSVERRPLEPEATKRLHDGPVHISSLFEASGQGEHASYGAAIRGSYFYTTTVIAQSEVVTNKVDRETGYVHVVERRKFLQARDHLALSDVDVALALDTLPVNQIENWVNNACNLVAGISFVIAKVCPPAAPYAAAVGSSATVVKGTVSTTFSALHKIDGISARGLLGVFGMTKAPESLETFANDRISQYMLAKMHNVHEAIQSIEGKSFQITYTQEANGKPLWVDYARDDGTPITDAEWEVLRSANVFLDSNAVPNTRCHVGDDAWIIWADEVQELFGAVGKGRVDGHIRAELVDDKPDGLWTLQIEPSPSPITFRNDDDTIKGEMQVKEGKGLVDAKSASVKSLHVTASGNLGSLSRKRHFLFFEFVKRIEGDSNLRFTLNVSPAK